jgi:hypothetical protein
MFCVELNRCCFKTIWKNNSDCCCLLCLHVITFVHSISVIIIVSFSPPQTRPQRVEDWSAQDIHLVLENQSAGMLCGIWALLQVIVLCVWAVLWCSWAYKLTFCWTIHFNFDVLLAQLSSIYSLTIYSPHIHPPSLFLRTSPPSCISHPHRPQSTSAPRPSGGNCLYVCIIIIFDYLWLFMCFLFEV